MSQEFEGKVVLVTGGSSGIGRAAALGYAAGGATVVISARRAAESEETAALAQDAPGTIEFIRADMSAPDEIAALIADVVARHGRLDIAFNNAGVEGDTLRAHRLSEDVWNDLIAVNLTGVFLCMKHEITQMLRQGGGVIVNMASISGLVGTQLSVAYGASKFGVVGLTKCAALEYATDNIRVNAVCPGVIETPMADRLLSTDGEIDQAAWARNQAQHPMSRFGTADEVADAVLWLSSSRASFVTGHALPIDGGYVK